MKYNWKKAIANSALIFLGVIIAKVGDGNVPTAWVFWKATLIHAGEITVLAEARYLYAWLSTVGSNPAPAPPPAPPKG